MWFFKEKIYFGCNKCGECCRDMDIPLSHYDIIRIIKSGTGIDTETFITLYPAKENESDSVLLYEAFYTLYLSNKTSDNSCIFLKENICTIYNYRPNSCRTWPFSKNSLLRLSIDSEAKKLVSSSCDKNRFKEHSNISNLIDNGVIEVSEYRKLIKKWNKIVSENKKLQTFEKFILFISEQKEITKPNLY